MKHLKTDLGHEGVGRQELSSAVVIKMHDYIIAVNVCIRKVSPIVVVREWRLQVSSVFNRIDI